MSYDGSIREELAGYFEAKELKSRYLLIGIDHPPPTFDKKVVSKGGQKKVVRKSGQKTAERIVELLRRNPNLTQAALVADLGINRSALQKHLQALKASGRLRRIGPDKGGHWEVC